MKTPAGNRVDPFAVTNLTLYSDRLFEGFELTTGIYNLFDVSYSHPGGAQHAQDAIPQDGRQIRQSIVYRF